MRISTTQLLQQSVTTMLNQQARLSETELHIATGKKILTPSDDPAGASQAISLSANVTSMEQYIRNINFATGQLSQQENVLQQVGNSLQRIRELVIQGNNATQNDQTRRSIAVEIEGRLDELLSLANTRDASREYIFAGFQVENQPFSKQGNAFVYNGDQGQRFLQVNTGSQVAIRNSGARVFQQIPTGNGVFHTTVNPANSGNAVFAASISGNFIADDYSLVFTQVAPTDPVTYTVTGTNSGVVASGKFISGERINFNGVDLTITGEPKHGDEFIVSPSGNQDLFTTVKNIINTLNTSAIDPAGQGILHSNLGEALKNLDQAIGHMVDVRADVGVRLSNLESQSELNENFKLHLQKSLSEIQDLDYAEAISKLNMQLMALEAAQQAYIRIQGLTLFNFI